MRSPLLRALATLLSFALLTGCDSGAPRPTPVAIVVVQGDAPVATVGSTVPPVLIEIRDAEGTAIRGVRFTVTASGGGTVTPAAERTAAGATAVGPWTLGTVAGPQQLVISSGALPAVTVVATARAAGPATVEALPGTPTAVTGVVGNAAPVQPAVRVRDAFGNAVPGVAVAAVVTGGGSLQGGGALATDVAGVASAGGWTLGTQAGMQGVSLSAAGLPAVVFTATALPGPAAQLLPLTAAPAGAVVAGTLPNVQFALRDAFGNGISGQPVTFAVTAGGGSISTTAGTTDSEGRASPGTWSFGTIVGVNTLRASGAALVGTLSVQTVPGPAASVTTVAGAAQSAPVGTPLPIDPVFEARDQFGNAVSGQTMSFSVISGGGSVLVAGAATGSDGRASPGTWTLGPTLGAQVMRAQVGAASTQLEATGLAGGGGGGGGSAYSLEVRYIGAPPSAAIQQVFSAAATRVQAMITGDVPAVGFANFDYAAECFVDGPGWPVLNESVDDLVIFVRVADIDGVGNVLGSAGPCIVRSGSLLPVLGDMVLDAADLAALQASGGLQDVILHEMLHVVGLGVLWRSFAQATLQGEGGANPLFTGTQARAQFLALGGNAALFPSGVPVENTGGAGTRDGHWRESVFGRELMTGFYQGGQVNPLSAVTIAALGDHGYVVDLAAADAYSVSASLRASLLASPLPHTTLRAPRGSVGGDGRLRWLRATRQLPPS